MELQEKEALFQGFSFLHLEITLLFAKLSYAFEEKLFFSFCSIILSCLKMNLKNIS